MSAKTSFIKNLTFAKTAITTVNENENAEYLTYFTSNSIVVGKIGDLHPLKIDDMNKIAEALAGHPHAPTIMNVATGLFNFENSDTEVDEEQVIYLQDAQILTAQNRIINVNEFVIFSDQIVGIIPEKVDLMQIKANEVLPINR